MQGSDVTPVQPNKPTLMSVDTIRENERKQSEFSRDFDREVAEEQADFDRRLKAYDEFSRVASAGIPDGTVDMNLIRIFRTHGHPKQFETPLTTELAIDNIAFCSAELGSSNLIEDGLSLFFSEDEEAHLRSTKYTPRLG